MPTEELYTVEIATFVPPDGGYGWLVVIAAFLAHVITHGILYSFGVLFITIEERFGGSKADVSWILSISTGMLYLIGPVAGYLAGRYGIKMVTIMGAGIGALGFFLSMFVTNLFLLYVTLGFLTGCGFGMVFLGAIVIVTLYFDRRRSLASGIALSGAGGGAFIFSPLLKALTNFYSWHGTFLILTGLILNCIPIGLIFKPVTSYFIKRSQITTHKEESDTDDPEDVSKRLFHNKYGGCERPIEYDTTARIPPPDNTSDKPISIEMNNKIISTTADETKYNIKRSMSDETDYKTSKLTPDASFDVIETGRNDEYINESEDAPGVTTSLTTENKLEDIAQTERACSNKNEVNLHNQQHTNISSKGGDELQINKHFLDTHGEYSNSIEQRKRLMSGGEERNYYATHDKASDQRPSFLNQLELFRSKVFVTFLFSQFLFFLGFYLPFFYIPDKARQTGLSEEVAVWSVSTIGISSILGRIVLGYIADRPSVNRLLIFEAALLVSGLSTALGPLLLTPWSLFIYAPIYGIFTGIILSLTPVVLADLLGVNQLANAFGINNFFSGIASFMGPPLAGFLYDVTGNYNYSFVAAGISMTTAGVLMFVARCFKAEPTHR